MQQRSSEPFPLEDRRLAEVRTRYGALTVPDIRSDTIGRFLGHYGEWAWDEASFVASVLPDGAGVLDVGAFLGTFGLGVALLRPLRSLCFVEANGFVASLLEENVRRNAAVPATVVNALVTGGDLRPLPVGRADPGNLGSTSYAPDAKGDVDVERPAAETTLARLRDEHGPFDLVKLDAEGMELEILRGDAGFLSRGGTAVWAECNETPMSIDVAELLLSWGLKVHYFAFPSHNPDNVRGVTEAVLPLAYEAGLLAAPLVTPVLDEALRRHGCILKPIWNGEDLREALWHTPRWGMPGWQGAPAEQVAALAGRALHDDDRHSFLMPGWRHGRMLWEQVDILERTLRDEREAPAAKTAEIKAGAETERRSLERQLAEAAALALDRLADIGAVQEECQGLRDRLLEEEASADRLRTELVRLEAIEAEAERFREAEREALRLRDAEAARLTRVEAALKRLEADHAAQARELDAILRSATWRLARPAQRAVDALPPVHALLRLGRRAGGKARRLVRRGGA